MSKWGNVRKTWSVVADFEEGRGHESRNMDSLRSLEKPRNGLSPIASIKELSPTDTLVWVQWDPLWTSDFQNSKIINLCCFKPLSLWWIFCSRSYIQPNTIAVGNQTELYTSQPQPQGCVPSVNPKTVHQRMILLHKGIADLLRWVKFLTRWTREGQNLGL